MAYDDNENLAPSETAMLDVRGDVSVVCPTYNSAARIGPTLCSVLEQTVLPLEIIISDDGSTDDTHRTVVGRLEGCPIPWRFLRNHHHGSGAARNAGIRAAVGRWIAFIDSDDFWYPEKLAAVEGAARLSIECNFFCHNQERLARTGDRTLVDFAKYCVPHLKVAGILMLRNIFTPSAVVCRRDLLVEFGLFDEQLGSAQDHELWLRMSPALQPCMLPQALGCYVERDGSISSENPRIHFCNNWKLLARHRTKAGPWLYSVALARTLFEFTRRSLRRARLRLRSSPVRVARPVLRNQPQLRSRQLIAFCGQSLNYLRRQASLKGFAGGSLRVMLYHNIEECEMEGFATTLRSLATRWRFVTPDVFSAMVHGQERVSSDCLLLTFDDGFKSNFTVAREVLDPMGIKAIFFIPSGFVGLPDRLAEKDFIAQRMFQGRVSSSEVPDDLAALTVTELGGLIESGHTVGSHTRTHARLASIQSNFEMEDELRGSSLALERMLGTRVEHFAFPFGNL
ncbi:MAG: glycosyltransferase, partial [Acidobacteriota bacterium]|nr:glycosyltransferase [Acidobacteriota bacterium]